MRTQLGRRVTRCIRAAQIKPGLPAYMKATTVGNLVPPTPPAGYHDPKYLETTTLDPSRVSDNPRLWVEVTDYVVEHGIVPTTLDLGTLIEKAHSYDLLCTARDMGIDYYDSVNGVVVTDLTIWVNRRGGKVCQEETTQTK